MDRDVALQIKTLLNDTKTILTAIKEAIESDTSSGDNT